MTQIFETSGAQERLAPRGAIRSKCASPLAGPPCGRAARPFPQKGPPWNSCKQDGKGLAELPESTQDIGDSVGLPEHVHFGASAVVWVIPKRCFRDIGHSVGYPGTVELKKW